MPNLELSFVFFLEDFERNNVSHHFGPLFTKWLPNGEEDALTIPTEEPNINLKLWFSQFGYVKDEFITFDYDRQEVDRNYIEQQAVLEAGPLIGKLVLPTITEQELLVIKNDVIGDPLYKKIGKRIIRLIYYPVSRVIKILRINFGQYWIRETPEWDSRRESLGSYCANKLQLRWRCNPEEGYQDFCPTKKILSFNCTLHKEDYFSQYISKDDYLKIPEFLDLDNAPTVADLALLRAHENYDQGNLSYAVIDACTALEIAMSSFVRNSKSNSRLLEKARSAFFDQKKETQLFFISLGFEDILEEDLELAIGGIKLRNSVVHEGYKPNNNKENREKIDRLMEITAKLLPGSFFRFPTSNPGNHISSVAADETATCKESNDVP